MSPRTKPLPATLPADAKGFTRRMQMHLNFGADGGSATYSVHDADGEILPFNYAYRSGAKVKSANYSGFIFPGHQDKALTWAEVCRIWPDYVAAQTGSTP